MPITKSEFNEAHAARLGSLPTRIEDVLQRSEHAHTAREVAAKLLGIEGRYTQLLAPEVSAVLPVVQEVLDSLVFAGKLRSVSVPAQLTGPKTYYAKD
jgi:hypothetical protein